jgi:S-adenosylmethionine decarboxylase
MQKIYGKHLLMEGYVEDPQTLEPEKLCEMFDSLVWALGMQYLQRPMAMRVPLDPVRLGSDEDEGGWSVIAQITTSHISIHTWPLRRAFMLDVFSCRPFDEEVALGIVMNALGVEACTKQMIHRTGPDEARVAEALREG